jgi:hypothetical protein
MTKSEREKLTMTLGTIGDYMMLINRYKADCMQTISRISADNSRTTEFKNI